MATIDEAACRQALYQLIIAQLHHDGFAGVALAVASATSTVCMEGSASGNRLLELVQKAWAYDQTGIDLSGGLLQGLNFEDKTVRPAPPLLNESRVTVTHPAPIKAACFSPDGQYIATGAADGSARIILTHRLRQGPQIGKDDDQLPVVRLYEGQTQAVNDVLFHPNKPLLFTGSRDGLIRAFNYVSPGNAKPVQTFPDTFSIRSLAIHPAGRMLASATDDAVLRLYDLETSRCHSTYSTDQYLSPVNDVTFSLEGKWLGTANMDGTIKLWDVASGQFVTLFGAAHNGAEVTSLQFSKNGRHLLSSGKDGQTRLWDISNPRAPVHVYFPGMPKGPTPHRVVSSFSFNEQAVAMIDDSLQAVQVTDSVTGALIQRLVGHGGMVRHVTCSPCDFALLTCCDDGKLRIWQPPL
eukprot:GGOE01052961.1.p1 GENE.GGOE01052961.1~~GGOE01052961.1.p1  ORF type:complete len:424 (+),score=96.68 GGOE01052961.1:45-1274(+)